MNVKRYLIAVAAVFAALTVMDFVIHSVILAPSYAALASLWRPDMMSYMWLFYIGSCVMSFFFVFIFTKGYECKGIMEGVRYGLVIGLFMQVPGSLGQFAMYSIPVLLAVQWFIFGLIEFVVAGIIAAAIYRPE